MHAIVEIMGHRVRAGIVSEVQFGGATMLRIEHPTRKDHTARQVAEQLTRSANSSQRRIRDEPQA